MRIDQLASLSVAANLTPRPVNGSAGCRASSSPEPAHGHGDDESYDEGVGEARTEPASSVHQDPAASAASRAFSPMRCTVLSPTFSAAARASHLVRISSNSSSVRCSMPTNEL